MITFSSSKRIVVRSFAIVAASALLLASCSNKHLCDAYSYKAKEKNVGKAENVAYADPAVRANG